MKKSFGLKSISGMHLRSSNSGGGVVGIASSGLILHFDGANASSNTGSGNTWYNLAGTNHAAFTNASGYSSAPRSADGGGSFEMGESRSYAKIPTYPNTAIGTGDFSFNFWFKMGNLGIRQIMISKYHEWTAQFDWALLFRSDTQSCAFWAGNSVSLNISSSSNSVNSGSVWYNATVIRSSGVTKLYLNNVLQATSSSVANLTNAGSDIWMGYNKDLDEPMRGGGKIGHFSFYNVALSDSERTANYNALKTRFGY